MGILRKFSTDTIAFRCVGFALVCFGFCSSLAQDETVFPTQPGQVEETLELADEMGLLGGLGGVRERWRNNGVSAFASLTSDYFYNFRGGNDRDGAAAGLLDLGMELDLGVLTGLEGGSVFVNGFYFIGEDISGKAIGDFNAVNNIVTDTSFNVFNLYYRQEFGRAGSALKVGQIALDDDFFVSEGATLFLNAGFGPLPTQSGNTAAPIYALAAPGVMVEFAPESRWYCRFGAYAGDAGEADSSNQGFDWRLGGDAGFLAILEGGFRYGEDEASVCKVGAFHHSGVFEDLQSGNGGKGLGAVYLVLDHQVRPGGQGGPGVDCFFRASRSSDKEPASVARYIDGGIVLSDVCLADDALGFAMSWTEFTSGFRAAEGGSGSEVVAELTYQIPVTGWCILQPDLQYVIRPQAGGGDALVAGLRAEVVF